MVSKAIKNCFYVCLLLVVGNNNIVGSDFLGVKPAIKSFFRHDPAISQHAWSLLGNDAVLNRTAWKLINDWDRNWRFAKAAALTTAVVGGATYYAYDRIKMSNQEKAAELAKLQEAQRTAQEALAAQRAAHSMQQKENEAKLAAQQKQWEDQRLLNEASVSIGLIKSDIHNQQLSLENLELGKALQQMSGQLDMSIRECAQLHGRYIRMDLAYRQEIERLQKQIADLRQQSAEKMLELEAAYKFMGAKADAWKKSYQELREAYEQMRKRQESLPAPQKAAQNAASSSSPNVNDNEHYEEIIRELREQLKRAREEANVFWKKVVIVSNLVAVTAIGATTYVGEACVWK